MAKSDDKNTSKGKPISDVAEPGSSAPSPTSKSVIVPSRPIMKDPMMVDTEETDEKETQDKPLLGTSPDKGKPELKPQISAPDTDSNKPEDTPTGEPAVDEPETDETDKPETTTDDKPGLETPGEAEPGDKTGKKPKAEDAEATERAKHQAAIDKLADSKQYYLPINTVEKRRSRRFVGLGVLISLLLIIAWMDIALDAGLIHLGGIKPITHFFSN